MSRSELTYLITQQEQHVARWLQNSANPFPDLLAEADALRQRYFGKRVFLRGLIEYSNHCVRGCLYCGLREPNRHVKRYRLSAKEILACVRRGHQLGFQSFVLQGGEDPHYNGGGMVDVVAQIKAEFPHCAITLSMGELPDEMYARLRAVGADRYLLRHETANAEHYAKLHPASMRLQSRVRCLETLRGLGFAVGAGFMVGTPHQTQETLAEDLVFLRHLQPDMVGIGPFLPQSDTPFAKASPGALAMTLTMLALTRILLPRAPMPATTALGTLIPSGRELGLRCGANVVMPNLTPAERRPDYLLYDGKIGIDSNLRQITAAIESIGQIPDFSRGDPISPAISQVQG